MVSQTLPRDSAPTLPPGLRPMDPTRDLSDVARVIEVAFADELSPGGHAIMRDLRVMSALSPLLWVMGHALPATRDFWSGYVWEADGRVIANATVTRAEGTGSHWIVSNVAVLPSYRRQGIARALMDASIHHARVRGGSHLLLQVRSDNLGAKRLYETLNFRYLEALTEMVSHTVRPLAAMPDGVLVRAPDPRRWFEAYEVASAAIPAAVQALRPLRSHHFRVPEPGLLERLRARFFGPARERWWAEWEGRVAGLLTIDRQFSPAGAALELLIHPRAIGQVEAALVGQAAARLEGQRGVRVSLAATLADARAHLRAIGFYELRTLDQMVLALDNGL